MDEHDLITITFHGFGGVTRNEVSCQLLMYGAVLGFFFIGVFIVKDIMKSKEPIYKKDGDTCDEVYCHKLKEHDFKYGIGILLLIMIFICTLTLSHNSTVMEYISFAGTVSSLILSVLAIMMTILAEANSNVANTKIDNHLNLVQQLHEKTEGQIKKYDQMIAKMDEIFEIELKVMNQIKALDGKLNNQSFAEANDPIWIDSQYEPEQKIRRSKNG